MTYVITLITCALLFFAVAYAIGEGHPKTAATSAALLTLVALFVLIVHAIAEYGAGKL